MTDAEHRIVMEAIHLAHRAETVKLGMQVARYRALLEENGIEPPDDEAEDFLQLARDAATVIETASQFVTRLGTSKELLADSWAQPKRYLRPA